MKAFRDVPVNDIEKKEQAGEDFVKKYPQSRYDVEVYSWLVKGYLNSGQVDKMEAAGDKELALKPDDAQTLAILGSTLPRAMNASTPEPEKLRPTPELGQHTEAILRELGYGDGAIADLRAREVV